MRMQIKKEILINADVKKVWKIFSKLERWSMWSDCITNAKWISKTEWKTGSKFTQTVKGFGIFRAFKSNPVILDVKLFKLISWSGTRKLIKGVHTFKFQKIGNKTKVLNIEHFRGLLAPFIFPLIKNKFGLYFEQFLNGLKIEAEK
mgnify:CR=1 FL=1